MYCLLLMSGKSSLYSGYKCPLSDIQFANIFSISMGCLFTFLIVSFEAQKFSILMKVKVKVAQFCPTLCSVQLYSPWNSPGQNTRVGSLSLLQGIFPTQGLNLGLLHCRQFLYHRSYKGSPKILEWVAYPFCSGSSWHRNQTGSPELQADSLPTDLLFMYLGFPGGASGKEPVCQYRRHRGLIPELGRSPGGGHGNPLQYSCLENPMERGAWQATV